MEQVMVVKTSCCGDMYIITDEVIGAVGLSSYEKAKAYLSFVTRDLTCWRCGKTYKIGFNTIKMWKWIFDKVKTVKGEG